MRQDVRKCLDFIRSRTDFIPKAGLILGSGLGGFAEKLDPIICRIRFDEMPDFPVSTVSGHEGEFIMGYSGNVPVICMNGRVHYYEGYSPQEVVLPIRLMRAMGAEFLILTNAAGGINDNYTPGTLVMLKDHISLYVPNPLIGENDSEEGERFPDMSEVYDRKLRKQIEEAANSVNVFPERGIYCQLSGPSYETPSEIAFLERMGVDLVGMSTVMEAIAARHAGMKVCGISLVTNMAAGIKASGLSHEEVKEAGREAAPKFSRLITAALGVIERY